MCTLTCHLHEKERVVVQGTVVMHIRLHAPVVIKLLQQWMMLKEAAEIPARQGGVLWHEDCV